MDFEVESIKPKERSEKSDELIYKTCKVYI